MTHTDRHEWVLAHLSEHVNGALAATERDAVDRHLTECVACARVRADFADLVREARALGPVEPPRDLWPDVLSGLEDRENALEADLDAGARPAFPRRRICLTVSVPQLAAAAVVLVTLSASAAWWARGGLEDPSDVAGPGSASGAIGLASAPAETPLPEPLIRELSVLEAALDEGRGRLDPGTVDVLERNLLVIERAIEDSYRALALDPENEFLREHLERTYQRKLEYLREVSWIVDRAG